MIKTVKRTLIYEGDGEEIDKILAMSNVSEEKPLVASKFRIRELPKSSYLNPFTDEGERLGIVEIPQRIILQDPEFVMQVMGSGIVIRAELMWGHPQAMEYRILCSEFDILLPGKIIPKYWIDIWTKGRKIVWWRYRKQGVGEDAPVLTDLDLQPTDLGGEDDGKDDARSEVDQD